jgi:WD40 repeat protein
MGSFDGRLVISNPEDKSFKVWNLESGEVIQTIETYNDAVIVSSDKSDRESAILDSNTFIIK